MSLAKNPKYDLKLKYKRTFEVSFIISLLLLISAFKFFPNIEKKFVKPELPQDIIIAQEDIEITKQNKNIPPPPRPVLAEVNLPEGDDIILDDFDLNTNVNVDLPKNFFSEDKKRIIEEKNDHEFIVVEDMPEPIGGIEAILSKIKYPELAKKLGIEGVVVIYASVNENGDVVRTEVAKGIGGGCDEVAADAVMKTKFNPGKQRGKPVKVKVSVPVKFVLH